MDEKAVIQVPKNYPINFGVLAKNNIVQGGKEKEANSYLGVGNLGVYSASCSLDIFSLIQV